MWNFAPKQILRSRWKASAYLILVICVQANVIFVSSNSYCVKDGCSETKLEGNLKPLQDQRPAKGTIDELRFAPSGQLFYHKYIHGRRPVVIRGGASHWPAIQKWKNESYLRKNFGSDLYTVEYRKSFKNEFPVRKPMTLAEYLDIYKTEDVYLDSQFPRTSMIKDILLPSVLHCGEVVSRIMNLNMLFSSGGTSSAFHHDGYENVISVISGEKTFLLMNSSYADSLYADDFLVVAGVLPIDLEKVNLKKFPKFANVPYHEVTLREGDMMYVPQYWWHQVKSTGSPNIAINVWFSQFESEAAFAEAGLSEDKDVVRTTLMFDELVKKEPDTIHCTEEKPPLNQILKIDLDDPKSGHLRIPKKNKRPADVMLASGYTMPVMGLGTATLMENTTFAVRTALKSGYRMIDTAQGYPLSESLVAEGISQSGVPRKDIFIITKLHPKFLGYETTKVAVENSLRNLRTDYTDLFLIHSKFCDDFLLTCEKGEPHGTWQESWKAMEEMSKEGKIRSLGVSNFDIADLEELVKFATVPVSALQNWFDPFHQDNKTRMFCQEHGIRYIGYSTLGTHWGYFYGLKKNPVLNSELLLDISGHYEFVSSQVVLRWAIHKNVTVIPRSKSERNIYLNIRALDFNLTADEIEYIDDIAEYDLHPLERVDSGIDCDDHNDKCPEWAAAGECKKNPDWMLLHCKESCGLCYQYNLDEMQSSSSPVVYVGSDDHHMYSLTRSDGKVEWKFKTGNKVQSTATVSDDGQSLYFGSNDGNLYALQASDGKLQWSFTTGGAIVARPVLSKTGTLFVGAHDGLLHVLHASNGTVNWQRQLKGPIWASVALDEQRGLVFGGSAADEGPRVYALNVKTGDVVWSFDQAGKIYSSPAVSYDGKNVFFCSLDHHVYALEASTGKLVWSYDSGSEIESSPAISRDDGTLYVGLVQDKVIAINTAAGPLSGKLKWSADAGGEVVSSPVLTEDGRVFIGSGDGRILAMNQTDGRVLWSPATRDYVSSSVAVSGNNVVFASSNDKNVYALDGQDGAIIWSFETGEAVLSSPALPPDYRMPAAK